MTDQRLRDLLEERVADLPPVDLAGDAWSRAAQVRRRSRTVVGAVVGVVAAVGLAAAVSTAGGGDAPPPPVSTPSTSSGAPAPQAERGGTYGDAEVWWAPDASEEADLPLLGGGPLPPLIDLSADGTEIPVGVRATGLFQLWGDEPGAVVVVGADGVTYSLDVSRLEPVADGGGNAFAPVSQESLAPDGSQAFFRQEGSLEVYDFTTGEWTSIDARAGWDLEHAAWSGDAASIRVPVAGVIDPEYALVSPAGVPLGTSTEPDVFTGARTQDEGYGPIVRGDAVAARSFWLQGTLRAPDGARIAGAEAIAVGDEDSTEGVLAVPSAASGDEGRWLQCCNVVGWADPGTVLFESRHEDARILAWRVGTPEVYRVADIRGWAPGEESFVASFADPTVDGESPEDESDPGQGLPSAERGPAYGGAKIWWGPAAAEETALPWLGDSPLPRIIDLSDGLPAVQAGVRAQGVFKVRDRLVVLVDGISYSLEARHLERVTDEDGNAIDSLGDVSPDGRRVFFVQRSSLEVYDLEVGGWSTIDTPDWLAEGAEWLGSERIWVPDALGSEVGTAYSLTGGAEPAGLSRVGDLWDAPGAQAMLPAMDYGDAAPYASMVAQDYVVSEPMTRPDGSSAGGVHVLHVGAPEAGPGAGLAYPFVSGDRALGSISVVDWATPTRVLYWSASASAGRRILAWDVGTRWVDRVSEIAGVGPGDPVGASFADLTAPGD